MKTYQKFLMDKLAERKIRNPLFSLRALAKLLKMSPGQLSSLINGRKILTPRQAIKIINCFSLDEHQAHELLKDMLPNNVTDKFQIPELKVLSLDEFKLISDWHHFAILSLAQFKNNRAHSKWIAHKLGIETTKANEGLERLVRLGLIEIRDGQFFHVTQPITTTSDVPSTAIRSYHKQNLELAKDKLELVPVEERVFSAITMAIDPRKLDKAKKMIFDFKQKLCKEIESSDPKEVYTLAIQLFPLTK